MAVLVWLCLCGIWGSTWLGIKLGLRDLPPLTFAGIRFALAAMVLGAMIAIRRVRLPWAARDWRLLAYTGLLTITINYALVFWGEQTWQEMQYSGITYFADEAASTTSAVEK